MSLLTFMEFEEFGSVRENGGGYCRLLWTVLPRLAWLYTGAERGPQNGARVLINKG
jgi:hypothetical protein